MAFIEDLLLAVMILLSTLYASWFFFAAIPRKEASSGRRPYLTVVVPAYNEASDIRKTLESIVSANYPGKKEIIVVDDGSTDGTPDIVKNFMKSCKSVKLIRTGHVGKAKAVNAAIRRARGEIVAVLDADTEIDRSALIEIVKPFSTKNVAAVSTTVRVKSTSNPLTWLQEFEYAISSGWRFVADNAKGSCVVPGFCAFRKSMLLDIGGMKGDTAVEDYDICMYLKKAGYHIKMAPKAIAYTVVPKTFRGLLRQRFRWARGTLQMLRKHRDIILNKKYSAVGLYSVPIQTYWFMHALVYIPLISYQIINGYFQWFASKGMWFTSDSIIYFVKWLTMYGTFDYTYRIATSEYPLNPLNMMTLIVIFLSFGFGVYSVIKFSKPSFRTAFSLFFFFPYTIIVMTMHIASIAYQVLEKDRGEKWEKVR
jgi:cellulose synthase/poly-beta-1,6-N-acetylglucosamine synthase-like glycosyltransferase